MNPTSASLPAAPRVVNDVAAPTPDAPMAAAASNIVANIPVHNAQAPIAAAKEDDELDKIMHAVGQEMKKEDKVPQKRGFLGFGHKSKDKPPVRGPVVQQAPMPQPVSLASTAPARAAPIVKPQNLPPAAVKRLESKSVPVFAIFVALLAVGFLTAAAIAAYRQ